MLIVIIIGIFVLYIFFEIGFLCGKRHQILAIQQLYEASIPEIRKNKERLQLANDWLNLFIDGKSIVDFFVSNNISNIAIYGYSINARVLEKIINASPINLQYIIDSCPENVKSKLPVYGINDELPEIDMIIITSVATKKLVLEKAMRNKNNLVYLREIFSVL